MVVRRAIIKIQSIGKRKTMLSSRIRRIISDIMKTPPLRKKDRIAIYHGITK